MLKRNPRRQKLFPMKNMQKALKDKVEEWLAFEPYRGPIHDKDANTA